MINWYVREELETKEDWRSYLDGLVGDTQMHTSDGNPNTVIREAARRALVTSLPSCPYRKLVEDVSRRVDLKGVRSLHEPRASWAHNLATFLHIT